MGQSIMVKCKECDYENEYSMGVGFTEPHIVQLSAENMKGIPSSVRKKLHELMKTKMLFVEFPGYRLYKCNKCKTLRNPNFVIVTDEDGNIVYQSCTTCPKCKKPMQEVNEDEFDYVLSERRDVVDEITECPCPKCGRQLETLGFMMFD